MRTAVIEMFFPCLETGHGELVFCCRRGMIFTWRFIKIAGVDKKIFCSRGDSVNIGIQIIIRPKWQCIESGVWALCLLRM